MHVNDILCHKDVQVLRDKLYANIDTSAGLDGCWPWVGNFTSKGYGVIKKGGKRHMIFAHRLIYAFLHGPLPERVNGEPTFVLHRCDNPVCCNPLHLFLGGNRDNVLDRNRKERQACGETNGRAKLTEEQVLEILRNAESDESIAYRFNVGPRTVRLIRDGLSWMHLKRRGRLAG